MLNTTPLIVIIALLPVVCQCFCGLPTLLPLNNRSWTVGSDGMYDFVKEQNCEWNLPNFNFARDILFLYISPFDFRKENRCLGDVGLDGIRVCSILKPECRLFTDTLANINFSYIRSQTGFDENPCATWRIENKLLQKISMRTFDAVGNLSFKIQYQYIKEQKEDAFEGERKDDDFVESEVDRGISLKPEIIREVCSACTGYIIAFAVTLFFLCIAIAILTRCAHMQSILIGKRQPRVRGSFFQTESIDDDVDEEALRSPAPLPTPKSPERKGNTSYFFQTMGEKDEEDKRSSGYVKAEAIKDEVGSPPMSPNFWVDENGESYYDTPRSTPAYSKAQKKPPQSKTER